MEDRVDGIGQECQRVLRGEEPDKSEACAYTPSAARLGAGGRGQSLPRYCTFSSPNMAIGPPAALAPNLERAFKVL